MSDAETKWRGGDSAKEREPRSPTVSNVDCKYSSSSPNSTVNNNDCNLDTVALDQNRSGSSKLQSSGDEDGEDTQPQPRRKTAGSFHASPDGPTQIAKHFAKHLPLANNEAMMTFEEIPSNIYQNNKVGRSRGYKKEATTCECEYEEGVDERMMACGEDSGCINRLTQIECRAIDCNCGSDCLNQRFQKRDFAKVDVVQTEKKGFGLRAAQRISADQLVYEYVGEVVEQTEFMGRMQLYKDEGRRHYYFMMLQREEFLDATQKGGVGRFINHSCNPNCYVSKWHVGKFMRMGIFSKRDVVEGEELTFNYNVDRYGNEAQACYCGEPDCVGSIGGKTQTDIGGMDQLFLDALGIADQVDKAGARGSRKKKSLRLDEVFTPLLRPMETDEVAKVITAIRQAGPNRTILHKLLMRIHMTRDVDVQRSLVQWHGFILMAGVLDEWRDDKDVLLLCMGSLARWPLIARNKVVDSGVDRIIKELSDSADEEISSLAQDLLSAWDALEMSYRIARREGARPQTFSLEHRRNDEVEYVAPSVSLRDARAPNTVSSRLEILAPKPLVKSNPEVARYSAGPRYSAGGRHATDGSRSTPPHYRVRHDTSKAPPLLTPKPAGRPASSIEDIIRKANEADAVRRRKVAEAASRAKVEEARAAAETLKRRASLRLSPIEKRRRTDGGDSDDGSIESVMDAASRRMSKLIGEVVVRFMSTFKEDLDRTIFKKHAKELTSIICDKEKRNPKVWPPRLTEERSKYLPDGLSPEKKGKIKLLVHDYTRKLVAHKGVHHENGADGGTPASTAQSAVDTPRDGPVLNESKADGIVSRHVNGTEPADVPIEGSPASGQSGATSFGDLSAESLHSLRRTTASTASTSTSVDHAAPSTPVDTNVVLLHGLSK